MIHSRGLNMERKHGCLIAIGGVALVTVGLLAGAAYQYGTAEDVTFTVRKTERIVEAEATDEGSRVTSKYLVFTDRETFENTDTLFYWKWNSSDLYGKLETGRTYRAKVYGWRVPIFSWYRNIVRADLVTHAPPTLGHTPAVGGASQGQGQPARANISINTAAGKVAATP
jgi:hypothetical protein